jgi:acetyl esterase/lipase
VDLQSNRQGETVKPIIPLIGLSAVLVCLIASAQTQQRAAGSGLAERFKQLDRNGDGKVSREEGVSLQFFDAADKNKDGFVTTEEVQAYFAARRTARPAAQQPAQRRATPPSAAENELVRKPDIRYATMEGVEPKFHSLDVYAPKGATNAPVMVMIHGGGFKHGDKSGPSIAGSMMSHFTGHGYVYVAPNYRLSPEQIGAPGVRHPTHAEDCARALAWVHDNIARHGGDPERIHLMGHSAGGALAGVLATNERFLQAAGKSLKIVRSNVLLDPEFYDIPYITEAKPGAMRGVKHIFGNDPAAWRDASPQHHVAPGKGIPPTLIFYTGERLGADKLAPALAGALTRAGVPAQAVDTVTLSHGEILSNVGKPGDPMTALIMRLHKGDDASTFPSRLSDGKKP